MRIEEGVKCRTTDLHVGEVCLSRALELDEPIIDDEGSRQRQKQNGRDALQLQLQE